MQEGGWFYREELGEAGIKAPEVPEGAAVDKAGIDGRPDLRFQPALDEEIYPVGGGGVILDQGAHIVVLFEAEGRLADPVLQGQLSTKLTPEVVGPEPFVDP